MDERLFLARVSDLAEIAEKTAAPHFLGFLSEEEAAVSNKYFKSKFYKYCFFGGFENAERKILCCMPEWCDNPAFPIVAVTYLYNSNYKLSHRDFLGALMSVGITRDSVGDILVEDGRAVIFLKEKIAPFVLTQIEKVGKVSVTGSIGFAKPLPEAGELIQCTVTVSSLRLDCIVSAVLGISRSAAVELIENSKISVNSLPTEKITKILSENDTFTIRGKGKFFIISASEHTKKGRVILNYNKYK